MAFYRATGQAHKPAPPVDTGKTAAPNKKKDEPDGERKHGRQIFYINVDIAKHINIKGMEEYIAADSITFDHQELFKKLQNLSLDWRLQDPFASLVFNIIYNL